MQLDVEARRLPDRQRDAAVLIRIESVVRHANFIGPHRQIGHAKRPVRSRHGRPSLVCLGFSDPHFSLRNGSPAGVVNRPFERCRPRLRFNAGPAHDSGQSDGQPS